jgi:outer membrane protein OmpA-like peptidoglycan-associated protein
MSYCANCGTQLEEGQKFCANCGTPAVGDTVSALVTASEASAPSPAVAAQQSPNRTFAQSSSESALQKLAMLKAQELPPKKRSGSKFLIATVVIILLGGVAAIGGVVYLGYRVKQTAHAALNRVNDAAPGSRRKASSDEVAGTPAGDKNNEQSGGNESDNPLSSLVGKLQGGDSTTPAGNMAKNILEDLGVKDPGLPPELVRNIPYAAVKNPLPCPTGGNGIDPVKLAIGRIQIKPGTILTTSWSLPKADAESDHIIGSVSPAALAFQLSGTAALGLDMHDKWHVVLNNTVCGKDAEQGKAFSTGWMFASEGNNMTAPGLYPGISRILLPATKLSELKASGSTEMIFAFYDYMDTLTEWELLAWKGTLTRVEPDDVPFPLIINDERVNVAAIHVRGNMKVLENAGRFGERDQPAEAFILDDPNTPVVLSWMFGKGLKQDDAFRVQYIRVRYPGADKPTIEQQLAKQRKAITWGINFDFNSDVIRPESEPVLKEIADAMAHRPEWNLTISGHTDNVGGHEYNLELSDRRSAAVKRALVERYHANPARLSTAGHGDSDPIDTNDTLEGRARNRRVELTLD